jgi:hypothetical protein
MQMAQIYISHIRNYLIKKAENICFSGKIKSANKDILLVKLDKLGDYILFRNFIEMAYKEHHPSGRLVLCGNIAWKELAEKLDGAFIHKFVWIDPARLQDNLYRFSVYQKIRQAKCNRIINCSYSRTNECDKIVMHSGAKETVGFYGDDTNMLAQIKELNDAKYTLLAPSPEQCMFEFYGTNYFLNIFLRQAYKLINHT